MQFAYNLTRKESNTTVSVNEVISIFGKDITITLGTQIPTLCASILANIDSITATYRTEFSRTFSNEKYNYMSGLFDTASGITSEYNYSMVFYNATDDIYYSIMGSNIAIANFVTSVTTKLANEYGITATGTGDKNIFLKSCVLEVL